MATRSGPPKVVVVLGFSLAAAILALAAALGVLALRRHDPPATQTPAVFTVPASPSTQPTTESPPVTVDLPAGSVLVDGVVVRKVGSRTIGGRMCSVTFELLPNRPIALSVVDFFVLDANGAALDSAMTFPGSLAANAPFLVEARFLGTPCEPIREWVVQW